ncbi:hypothetical protein KOW79_014145 [Hemibagrus wyckioides]|uniref:Uncharacterized protein n=1 Tax=Hemibagrus wyckioides TaxID=337641 RepID=A0A9D3NJ99_9TELE|nr:hypothetical protein KOW79_014145 [Hemibagrus wyckioides]
MNGDEMENERRKDSFSEFNFEQCGNASGAVGAPICTKPSPGDRRCSHGRRDICITKHRSLQTELMEEEAHAHFSILCLPRSMSLSLSCSLSLVPDSVSPLTSGPVRINLIDRSGLAAE